MRYHIYKNFISEEECEVLSTWIIENQNSSYFGPANHRGTIRKTTRFSKDVIYPEAIYNIQKNIDKVVTELFSLDNIIRVQYFPNGMYASIGLSDDWCMEHKDPRYLYNHYTYHFNIMLSSYENADLYIDNQMVQLSKLDGILYPVSEVAHYTTKLTGTNPRLFWCFGYCIPIKKTGP